MTNENDSIVTDEYDIDTANHLVDDEDIANAFLEDTETLDAEKPSTKAVDEEDGEDEATDEHDAEEADGSDGNDSDEDHDNEASAEDDREFEIKVNGELKKFKLKDLKKTAGLEASLQQRTQDIAKREKELDTNYRDKAALQSEKLRARAYDKYKPYEKIDWIKEQALATKHGTLDDFNWHRDKASELLDEVRFYDNELANIDQVRKDEAKALQAELAAKCVEDLKTRLPDFDQNAYQVQKKFCVERGVNPNLFDSITDAAVFEMIDMAMKYAKGKSVQTKPVNKKPVTKVAVGKSNVEEVRKAAKPKPKNTGPITKSDDLTNAMLDFV